VVLLAFIAPFRRCSLGIVERLPPSASTGKYTTLYFSVPVQGPACPCRSDAQWRELNTQEPIDSEHRELYRGSPPKRAFVDAEKSICVESLYDCHTALTGKTAPLSKVTRMESLRGCHDSFAA